jgi:hypothetical protein
VTCDFGLWGGVEGTLSLKQISSLSSKSEHKGGRGRDSTRYVFGVGVGVSLSSLSRASLVVPLHFRRDESLLPLHVSHKCDEISFFLRLFLDFLLVSLFF